MHFKRFFNIKPENTNLFIIFNNNKVIFDLNDKTFLLNSSFLNFTNYNFKKIGIAEDGGVNIYAADISDQLFNLAEQGYKSLVEYDLRHLMTTLDENEMNLVGRANQLLHWLKSNKHCGYCGLEKKFDEKEEAMFCSCNSIMTYPTISPCVLALIKKIIRFFLQEMHFFLKVCIALWQCFIEVSETAEETVEREIYEEVSLKVKNIKYFGSQSWPFPSQLMLAYTCEYDSGTIEVDGQEIVEAHWFDLDNLPNTPPNSTLSGRLINSCTLDH